MAGAGSLRGMCSLLMARTLLWRGAGSLWDVQPSHGEDPPVAGRGLSTWDVQPSHGEDAPAAGHGLSGQVGSWAQ